MFFIQICILSLRSDNIDVNLCDLPVSVDGLLHGEKLARDWPGATDNGVVGDEGGDADIAANRVCRQRAKSRTVVVVANAELRRRRRRRR